MQKLTIFLFVLLAFTACKKDNDVAPADPAAAVAGTYVVSRIAVSGISPTDDFDSRYPQTSNGITYAGEVIVTQVANSTDRVDFVVNSKVTGQTDNEFVSADGVEVRRNGSNYDLYIGTVKLGTVAGNNMTIDATDQGVRYIVEARR